MSDTGGLVDLYTTQFSTNLELLLQQKGSKLRGRVTEGMHVGKQASPINQIGAITLQTSAGRFAPKGRTDPTFVRRWVSPTDGSINQLIDSFDELKTIVDPKSKYAENASNAVGRGWDDAIITAFFGSAMIGTDANSMTTESFDSTNNQVANNFGASATTGLTVAKLIEAQRILLHYHNDLDSDSPTIVIGSQQNSDLLKQVQVVSTDYNDKPVLVDGRVRRFLGFDVVISERLTVSSSDRYVPVFVKSGMYLGMWKDMTNRASIRNDLESEPWQLYTQVSFGATRTQTSGKVIRIMCNDTTGADITP